MSEPEVYGGVLDGRSPSFNIHGNPAELFAALAKAQGAFKPIVRSKTAYVRSDKGSYQYHYAELVDVLDATVPALSANGLTFIQPMCRNGEMWEVRSILAHTSGCYLETIAFFPHGGDWQKLGGAVTYARRYGAGGLLGVAPEDDDDGNAATGREAEIKPKTAPVPPKVERPKAAQQSAPPRQATQQEALQGPGDLAARQAGLDQGATQAQLGHDALQQQRAQIIALQQQQGLGANPLPEPAPEQPPSTPPETNGAKPSKASMDRMRSLIQELGMTKMVPEWCEKLLGVVPAKITLESQIQVLLADLEQRKAAT